MTVEETHGKRFAVIENEFGEIGIDDKLIARREDLGTEQIIEMNNGCICCTVAWQSHSCSESGLKLTWDRRTYLRSEVTLFKVCAAF